jgi:hypothetical protein
MFIAALGPFHWFVSKSTDFQFQGGKITRGRR